MQPSLIAYLTAALAFGAGAVHAPLEGQPIGKYPKFEVDPSWPKELPNNMIMGDPAGVAVDTNDHVWIYSTSDATPQQIQVIRRALVSSAAVAAVHRER